MPQPLTALSQRNVIKPTLQRGPGHPEVLADREIGGPHDPTDRRLVVDSRTLAHLLEIARSSTSGRVVLHQLGIRVQTLRDHTTGHIWDHCTLLGTEPGPEVTLFDGVVG